MGHTEPLGRRFQRHGHDRDLIDRGPPARLRAIVEPIHPFGGEALLPAITVGLETPTRSTMSLTDTPSAASNTIRARRAIPAGIDGARNQDSKISRSRGGTSTVTVNATHHDPENRHPGKAT